MSKIGLKGQYSLITVYVVNKRKNPENAAEGMMFQVHLKAYTKDESYAFLAEHICREILAEDEMKMNIHKDKMLWYNTSYCIRVSYERS